MTAVDQPPSAAQRVPSWEKPGPGTWTLDASHSGSAPGPVLRALIEECLTAGLTDGFELFGAPLQCMEMRWLNGRFYQRLVPLVGADKDMKAPPAPVLWLATRLHPAFRRRERTARRSFESKFHRSELQRWEEEWKPRLLATNRAFTDVDVSGLDDAGLARHLGDLHEHLRWSVALHFRLHVSDMGPLGDLMVHLEDWGLAAGDTFRALVSASPATRAPADHLRGLAQALDHAGVDPAALTSLDAVRSASPEAASALDEYLSVHGWRLTTGYDIEDRCLVEMPEVVLASIRAAFAEGRRTAPLDHDQRALDAITALRDEVPSEHREELDELVEDARLSYGLRDENGPLTYEWPGGIMRRGLLEAGTRLAASGRLGSSGQVFELSVDEVRGLLAGATEPTLAQVAERAAERRWWATLDPPRQLGPDDEPPPLWVMPPNLRRIMRIVLTVVGALEAEVGKEPLHGLGVGTTTRSGRARVVHDAAEALATMEPGDILVTHYTAPTYNAVLTMAGGLVTEQGGLLSHAAVIARELDIPAVVGAAAAMRNIPDGATVELDPVKGRVTVVG